jgi:hypothetical protein
MAMYQVRSGYKASTILASQEVMKWLILNAKGNVNIQTKNYPHPADPDGVTEEARLYCQQCKASKVFEFTAMLDEARLIQELEWAKAHKHDAGALYVQEPVPAESTGERKLKVVV